MGDPNLVNGAVLNADDAYARAETEWWRGHIDQAVMAYEEAYRRYLGEARPARAAAAAMAIAGSLFLRGDHAVGSGWLSRAQRLIGDLPDSVEHGTSWTPRMTAPGCGNCWPRRTRRWVMRMPPRASSPPPLRCSTGWAPRSTRDDSPRCVDGPVCREV
jgi:hypothetical protein